MIISELPSGSKTYPENSRFEIRKYTLGELKTLSETEQTFRERYEFVLSGIKPLVPMDIMNLSLYDVNFLGIQRKILTFNQNSFRFASYCDKCKKVVLDKIGADQISFYDMTAPDLPVNVTLNDGTEISFSIMTIGNFLALTDKNPEPQWDELMAAQCCSHSYNDALKILRENASVYDAEVLDRVDQILYHGIIPIDVTCQEITYIEKPNSLMSLADLNKMGYEQLRETAMSYGVGYDESMTNVTAIRNSLIMAMDLAEMTACGEERRITLGSGEGMIVGDSFRRDGNNIEDSISFGIKSSHSAERESETNV